MERGEVEVRSGFSYGSLATEHPDWIRDKKAVFLVQVGGVREPDLPDVPLMSELAKSDEQRQILTLISSTVALGRPYLTTPDVPADRVAALRQAFMATMADPAFLVEAKKLNFDLRPADGAAVSEGQVIYILETDKTARDIEAPTAGTLVHKAAAGETYEVGFEIGEIV